MKLGSRTKVYIYTHPLALSIAFFSMLTGLLIILLPEAQRMSLGLYLPDGLWYLWPIAHMAGGLLATWGLIRVSSRFEAAGMTLLTFTFFGQALAILEIQTFAVSFVSMIGFVSLGVGCGARALLLIYWRGHGY